MSGLSGRCPLSDLLGCAGPARSSCCYALPHPKMPTRPGLWEKAAETFPRTPNGCGHRQMAMCLRAEEGVRIAGKTVLKMMHEMGIGCGIGRETDYHRYSSCKGTVGKAFKDVLGRDFSADAPWEKLGTDATEFRQPWGKACLAPVPDLFDDETAAWSISQHPDMAQRHEMPDMLLPKVPEGCHPAMHSGMGWQHQQRGCCSRLEEAGIVQSMSRKGSCLNNARTEGLFGHIKDEFFRGRTWPDSESFKADLEACIVHWNTVRRQKRLGGLTPVEYGSQASEAAASC